MGYRIYGEQEPDPSKVTEFWIWFFIGFIGFPTQLGWVLVSFGLIDNATLFLVSGLIGTGLGFYFSARIKTIKK